MDPIPAPFTFNIVIPDAQISGSLSWLVQFRSSRNTRNTDANTLNRTRGGVIDHDPMEGLPVKRYEYRGVAIKQDDKIVDATKPAPKLSDKFPWSERLNPSWASEIPKHSQDLLFLARNQRYTGTPSVYDPKTETYISADEYAARHAMKSRHLGNTGSPEHDEDDEMDVDEDAEAERNKYVQEERVFTIKKWVPTDASIADQMPERRFLAARRPGMPSLYTVPGTNVVVGENGVTVGGNAGAGQAVVPSANRSMPPKRKKKKLGGPGRKKATAATPHGVATNGTEAVAEHIDGIDGTAETTRVRQEGEAGEAIGDGEGAGEEDSEGDEEGSEEGEIGEGGETEEKPIAEVDLLGGLEEHVKVMESDAGTEKAEI